jgi:hypothetical protein
MVELMERVLAGPMQRWTRVRMDESLVAGKDATNTQGTGHHSNSCYREESGLLVKEVGSTASRYLSRARE